MIFSHSTVAQLRARGRQEYQAATGKRAVLLGAFLATLSDGQLATIFGLTNPSAPLTALRTKVNKQAQIKADALAEAGQ